MDVKIPTLSQKRDKGGAPAPLYFLFSLNLSGGDAADQVFLLLLVFRADGEGVEYA